jgi:heme A synthase
MKVYTAFICKSIVVNLKDMNSSIYENIQTKEVTENYPRLFSTLALTGLVSTIILIMIGSFVRVTGNGLGCPDWPLCYGRAVPPLDISAWVEFSHRLFGGFVSLQIAALIYLAWRHYRSNKLIWRTAVASGIVLIIQVSLGGLHVLNELPRWTGLIHTGVAMAIAGLLALLVAVTHPELIALARNREALFGRTRLKLGAVVGAAATYLLLLTGSLVTRTGASLACPSFPHCGVRDVPESLSGLVTIQLIHRFTAFSIAAIILIVIWQLLNHGRTSKPARQIAYGLGILLLPQFALGMSNVLLSLPIWSRILHLGVGGSIWVLMLILAVTLSHNQPSQTA